MGKANLPAVRKNTLPANWQEQMKADAAKGKQQVAHIGVGQFMSTRGGLLQFQGTPVPGNKMNAVLLAACLENAFYEGEFDPNNPTPPSCYAFGEVDSEMAPHEAVKKPVSDSCVDCENNKFGSAETGRGKACKNGVRIALIHADELKKGDVKDSQLAFLKVPPTSLPGWKAFMESLEGFGDMPMYGVVTEVQVVPDPKSQFKVVFNALRRVDKKAMPSVFGKAKASETSLKQPYQEIDTTQLKKSAKKKSAKKGGRQAAPQRAAPAAPRRKF